MNKTLEKTILIEMNRGSSSGNPDRMPAPQSPLLFPRPLQKKKLWVGFLILFLSGAAVPFANWTYPAIYHFLRHLPLDGFYSAATQFPSAPLIIIILAGIYRLQPRRRLTIFYFLIALLFSSTVNESLKYVTSRARPRYSIRMGDTEKIWIENYRKAHPGAPIRAERADQWLGLSAGKLRFTDSYASFPSGHANSAFVLATYLAALWPEGRVIWYLAAGGTGMARVAKERHWPEDASFGGSLGWLMAQLVFSWAWPGRLGLWLHDRGKILWLHIQKRRGATSDTSQSIG